MKILSLLSCLLPPFVALADPQTSVLLLSGANNHDWKSTTPAIKEVLEKTGCFAVTVTENPQTLSPDALNRFDVIVSNFNTFTARNKPPRDAQWSDPMCAAYLEFVKTGKGHVTVHAGSASFYDWPEYHILCLGTFRIGQTSHGKYHAFSVKIADAEHSITRGVADFAITDKLWHDTAFAPGAKVLAKAFSSKESGGSGKDEPVLVAGEVGKGRSVFVVLGHDAKAIRSDGFATLLVRSVEWAAHGDTANVSGLLEIAASKDAPLIERRAALVRLKSQATVQAIPRLVELLEDPLITTDVRGVLEAIPGDQATAALHTALAGAKGATAAGIVASLGARRDARSIGAIAPLLAAEDNVLALSAARALAQIGGETAFARLLASASHVTKSELRAAIIEGLLATAARPDHWQRLTAMEFPEPVRVHATAKLLVTDDAIRAATKGDAVARSAAIDALAHANKPALTLAVASESRADARLLSLLIDQSAAATDLFIRHLTDEDAAIRQLAIAGLARSGDEKAVAPLLAAAGRLDTAKSDRAANREMEQIRSALVQLKPDGVNDALLNAASTPSGAIAVRALVDRGAVSALPRLIELARSNDARLAAEAVRGVGELGGVSAAQALVAVLIDPATPIESQARAALVAHAKRHSRDISAVTAAYASADTGARVRLLKALAPIGGAAALSLAERASSDPDGGVATEAIRALAAWSDSASLERLRTVTASNATAAQKTIALRGVARLVPLAAQPKQRKIAMLEDAIKAAPDQPTRNVLAAALEDVKKAKEPALNWIADDKSVALAQGRQILWRFNHDPSLGKPYFDPLSVAGHPSIARSMPADHVWHYGLWFSWKYLNKVNYWEEDKNHKAAGRTTWDTLKVQRQADGSAVITMNLDYCQPGRPIVLDEQRTIAIRAPASDGSYTMDWTMVFRAGAADVVLDRTPLPGEPGGQSFGGYAGLSMRMQQLANHKIINTRGPVEFNKENRHRERDAAMDYTGELEGKMTGVAIIDHPQNLHSPSPWYAIRDRNMNYFNAALLCFEPATIKAGTSFTLRYRVIVHPGALSVEELKAAVKEFADAN